MICNFLSLHDFIQADCDHLGPTCLGLVFNLTLPLFLDLISPSRFGPYCELPVCF